MYLTQIEYYISVIYLWTFVEDYLVGMIVCAIVACAIVVCAIVVCMIMIVFVGILVVVNKQLN